MLSIRLMAALALAATMLAGCGDADSRHAASEPSRAEDGGTYYFEQVQFVHDVLAPDVHGEPSSLRDALPCARGSADLLPTSAIVSGTVTDVSPGEAKIWGKEEDSVTYADDFFATDVDERNVVVTVAADEGLTSAGDSLDGDVRFRVGVLGGADPQRFMDSLASMGQVIAVLATHGDGSDQGEYYPRLGGGGLGLVDPTTGQVAFPGLGKASDSFVGLLSTLDRALAVCLG